MLFFTGGLILQKEKQTDVKIKNQKAVPSSVNNPRFKNLSRINDDLYEIESAKGRITLDLPTYLAFTVLQLAKLHMLRFYYEFLDVFVDRSKFHYCNMDTGKYFTYFLTKYMMYVT